MVTKSRLPIARFFIALVLVLSNAGVALAAPQEATPQKPLNTSHPDRLAPFVPTPPSVIEKMLELAQVDRTDRVYDLGSGDGRIVIMAAEKFHAEAVGVELDENLVKQSREKIAELKLEKRAKIIHGNMYEIDLHPATVVTLYLLTSVNERLKPILEKQLRPGARIVSHDFQVPGWTAEKTVTAATRSEERRVGKECRL